MNATITAPHHADSSQLISASTINSTAVYNLAGEKLGSVDDLMIDKRDGKVAYAIMSFGGFLGIGEKFHPLPWHMLDYDADMDGYRVPLDADRLTNAPQYSRDELASSDWRGATDGHYTGAANPATRTANLI